MKSYMTLCTVQGKTTAHVIFVNSMTNFLMPTTQDRIWRQSIYCPYVHWTIILFKWTGPLISQENKEIHSFEILRHKLCINFITLLHFNWFILCIQPSVIILSNGIWVELWIQYNTINITIAIKDLTSMRQWIDTPVLHGKKLRVILAFDW